MADKRLNDTKSVAAMPKRGGMHSESTSTEIRQIVNGYIERKSKCDSHGGYASSETFHTEKPSIDPMAKGSGSSMMKAAVDYIKK